jgi:hypothetical protein
MTSPTFPPKNLKNAENMMEDVFFIKCSAKVPLAQ